MTKTQQTKHRSTGAMAMVGASILTAHLVTATPDYPEVKAVVQPVQLVAFTSPSAAQLRAASDVVGNQSTGGPAQPFPIDLTVGDIGAKIVEAVATAIAAPFVIAFFAVIWVVSQLQRLVAGPAESVVLTASAASAEPTPTVAVAIAHTPRPTTTRSSGTKQTRRSAHRAQPRGSAATSIRTSLPATVGDHPGRIAANNASATRPGEGPRATAKSTGRSAPRQSPSAQTGGSDQ